MKPQFMLVSPFKSMASNLYPRPWGGVVLGALRATVALDKLTASRRGPLVTLGSRPPFFNRVVKVPHLDRKPNGAALVAKGIGDEHVVTLRPRLCFWDCVATVQTQRRQRAHKVHRLRCSSPLSH